MKKVLLTIAVAQLMACTSKDVFDPEFSEKESKLDYSTSFVQHYPNVDLNQSWDFSNKNPKFSLPGSGSAQTRAASYTFKETDWYEVDNNTLTWLKSKLADGTDHRSLGSPFYMSVPNNSFTIVPIFQGIAGLSWDLHLVVDGVDIKVWSKSQDLQLKKTANGDWINVYDVSTTESNRCTEGAAAVRSIGYTFENLPVGKEMYFYLIITATNGNTVNTLNAEESSLNGMMLALQDCPRPANIGEDNEVMIIGCEDVHSSSSDWDYNDVVFMVYGKPFVPQPVRIEEGNPIIKKTTVRYMIEDLGSTDDFDFNDIVVDVSDIWTSTPKYVNGVLDSWIDSDNRQEAVIRHLGGTLPFILKIGNTELAEHEGVLGSDPDEKFDVTGWSSTAHNVSIKVRQQQNSTVYNNVKFPKAGEAPMIIAVEPTVGWMKERVSVPESWFIVPTK